MKKRILINSIKSIVIICFIYGGNYYTDYINASRESNFNYSISDAMFMFLFPVFLGLLMSFPEKINKDNFNGVNWNKLILQGIPAFILAVPWQIAVFVYMDFMNISTIGFGILNGFVKFHEKLGYYYIISGVWLGSIIINSVKYSK